MGSGGGQTSRPPGEMSWGWKEKRWRWKWSSRVPRRRVGSLREWAYIRISKSIWNGGRSANRGRLARQWRRLSVGVNPAHLTRLLPAKWRNHNRRETSETTHHSLHFHPTHYLTQFTSPFHLESAQDRCCATFLPSRSHLFSPSHGIHSQSFHPLPLPWPSFSHQEGEPTRALGEPPSPLLLIRAAPRPSPTPFCGCRVHAGWVAFVCMVCD